MEKIFIYKKDIMKKIAQFVRNYMYVAIFIIMCAAAAKTHAFWPPDVIPHPECPQEKTENEIMQDWTDEVLDNLIGDRDGEGHWS